MSGIEVAGLAIGIIPVFVEILKFYSRANDKLRTFNSYHKAVRKIDLDFRLEGKKFRDECDRLLAVVIESDHERQSMLQDPTDLRWRETNTNRRFQDFLGDDYYNCEEMIILIRDLLRETMVDLERVGRLLDTATHKSDGIQRVFNAIHLSIKEGTYKRRLEELRDWNAKLRHLRKRKCESQTPRQLPSTSALSRKIPSSFCRIRESSKALHCSLEEAWTCSNVSHEDHQAKLWLDATEHIGSVRLNIATSCRPKDAQTKPRLSREPIWMYVQSVTMQNEERELEAAATPIGVELAASLQTQTDAQTLSQQQNKQQERTPSLLTGIKRSRKRVRFDRAAIKDQDSELPSAKNRKAATLPINDNNECHSMLNLRNLESFCSHLNQFSSSPAACKVSCLGFLEMQNSFKFIFYNAGKKAIASTGNRSEEKEAKPLNDALGDLSRLQRLLLAHRLAKAVLHYHSTPWLPEEWRLHDLSFFGDQVQSEEDDLAKELETLHLSTQFPPKQRLDPPNNTSATASSCIVQKGKSVDETYYTYGIKNMTLAGLGLALLEIGHRRDIKSFQMKQPHDVVSARILMERSHTELGGRYHKIAQRCLDCDFSLGGDLCDEGLQSGVYSHVVCGLEELIKAQRRFETEMS